MFDIGWTELALIAGAAIVLTKPEDMPGLLRSLGRIVRKFRVFTSDIQKSLDGIVRDSEVDDLANEINNKIGGPDLQFEIERQIAEEERLKSEEKETNG